MCFQTLYILEHVAEVTCVAAETGHERWFQETYGQLIEDALERLRNPQDPSQPHTSWTLFKQVDICIILF